MAKRQKKIVKMCDCCHEKKATLQNANGQWCCRKCDSTVTHINKASGRIYNRIPEFRELYNKPHQKYKKE